MSDTMQPLIRAYTIQDLQDVLGLLHQLDEFTDSETTIEDDRLEELFAEMAAAPAFYTNLVCEIEGRAAGFLSIIFYRTPFHTGGTALINELIVDQDYRGRGLGQALIAHAIALARTRGMDEIEVGTEKSNLAAQKFYKKAGFDEEHVLLGMDL